MKVLPSKPAKAQARSRSQGLRCTFAGEKKGIEKGQQKKCGRYITNRRRW